MMQSSLPSIGLGILKPKDLQTGPPSADKVSPALIAQGDFYRELAKNCAQNSVAVSLILTPSSTVDLATTSMNALYICMIMNNGNFCRKFGKFHEWKHCYVSKILF